MVKFGTHAWNNGYSSVEPVSESVTEGRELGKGLDDVALVVVEVVTVVVGEVVVVVVVGCALVVVVVGVVDVVVVVDVDCVDVFPSPIAA